MKLSQLEYFWTISELGSFTKAAERLHITQPSLSKAILELEREVGTALLLRTKNGVLLTPDGQTFLKQALQVLREMEELTHLSESMKKKEHTLRVGIPPTIGYCFIPRLAEALSRHAPHLQINWKEGGTHSLGQQLRAGTLDAAILPYGFTSTENMSVERLRTLEEVLYVSNQHPLASKSQITADMLMKETFALFSEEYNQNVSFQDLFDHAGFYPQHVLYTSQLSTALNFIKQNMAVSILIGDIAKQSSLAITPVSLEPPYYMELVLLWREQNHSAWLREFAAITCAVLSDK